MVSGPLRVARLWCAGREACKRNNRVLAVVVLAPGAVGGSPREGFRINQQRGGPRVRKLPWMSGNKGIEIKEARLHSEGARRQMWRRGRCEEVNGSLLVTSSGLADLASVFVSVWGRRTEGRELGDLITKCLPPC